MATRQTGDTDTMPDNPEKHMSGETRKAFHVLALLAMLFAVPLALIIAFILVVILL